MAFTPETISIIVQPIGGEGMRFVSYKTDDAQATVTATDYFFNAERYGIKLSDLIFVSPISAAFDAYVLVVTAIDADGNVTASVNEEEMQASVYDPQGIVGDAFARANHTGAQAIATVTGLQTALDAKMATANNLSELTATAATARANIGAGDLFASNNLSDLADAATARTNLGIVAQPAVAADSMLVDNAAGTLRETKTFAEVRTLLSVPTFDELPFYLAWEHGVLGDGTDESVAFQSLLDLVNTAGGGTIIIRGAISHATALDMTGFRNVRILGQEGLLAGSSYKANIRYSGTGGSGFESIIAPTTLNCTFENIGFYATNASFQGAILSLGKAAPIPGEDSAYNHVVNCTFGSASLSTGVILVWLYGATITTLERNSFNWNNGTALRLQDTAGTGFCNVIRVINNQFGSAGNGFPIHGSGEGILFSGNNVQACADGGMRFWTTSLAQPFRSITIIGNTFYDASLASVEASYFYWGYGLTITGNYFSNVAGSNNLILGGGGTGGDPGIKGVQGFSITGNHFSGGSNHVAFTGTTAAQTNARYGVVQGNSVINGAIIGYGYTECQHLLAGPNSVYGGSLTFGASMSFQGFPIYADRAAAAGAGMTTGMMYLASGVPGKYTVEVV